MGAKKSTIQISTGKVRLMKSDIYGLTKEEQVFEFYVNNPVQACRDMLNIELSWFQRIQLRELWLKPYCLMKWSRGTSKSFMIAVYLVLKAMLFPDMKIGIIGPSMRQGSFVFDEIETIYANSPFFRGAINGKITRTTERLIVKMFNNSFIEALPVGTDGSKIRGRRYQVIALDEFSFHDEKTINLVVRPFLAVKHGYKPNQIIIASTPFFKTNHFWQYYQRYKLKSRLEPELYSCTSFNFVDVLNANHKIHRIDMNQLYEAYHTQTLDEFLMEWGGFFPNESSGFFPPSLIVNCEPRINAIEIEKIGDPNSEYVMGIDPARSEDGDNFALAILKIINHDIKHLVRLLAVKGIDFPKLHDLIREQIHTRRFNITKICMDYGGGGQAIADLMMYGWVCDGVSYPPIVQAGGELAKNVIEFGKNAIPILDIIHFNVPFIDSSYSTLKADMEHKKLLFPLTVRRDLDPEIEEVGNQLAFLKSELSNLVPKATSKGLTFIGHPRLGKDRATSLMLANHAANLLYKKFLGEDIYKAPRILPVGSWI